MTKTYILRIPVRLAVEADTIAEARTKMFALWFEVMESLPTGAGAFRKEAEMRRHIISNTVG